MFKNTNLKLARNRGATLIEILITTVFVTMVLVALTNLTMVSLARNRAAKEQSVATRLAQEGVDWMKSERTRLGYNNFTTTLSSSELGYCMGYDFSLVDYDPDTCGFSVGDDTSEYIRRLIISEVGAASTVFKVSVIAPGKTDTEAITLSGAIYKWQR